MKSFEEKLTGAGIQTENMHQETFWESEGFRNFFCHDINS